LMKNSKTDAVDADTLAQYAERMDFVAWARPSDEKIALRSFARRIDALTRQKAAAKNNLHALSQSQETPKSVLRDVKLAISQLERRINRLSGDALALIRNHKLGFVLQNFNLLPRTSARDNVAMPLTYTAGHLSGQEVRLRVEELLHRFGLGDRLDHEPSQLSGGQQQRVAVARALVNRPSLILADEPTGNLDTRTSLEIIDIFQKLNQQSQITIILVTHEQEIARYASRQVIFRDGKIIQDLSFEPRQAAYDLTQMPPPTEEAIP